MSKILHFFSTPGRQFALFACALTALRVAALMAGHADLGPDEGQYWFWSKTPAFGYFSKPPMIAWSIAATTAIFGDAEWAVRLASPFYQLGAASFLFLLCRRIAGPSVAALAGVAWLTLPGVFLSAALITTDAPLTFFWCAALYFFFILTDAKPPIDRMTAAALLGAAVGFGFLSKYAMSYFALGVPLALILSPQRRRAAGPAALAFSALIALALIAPNICWNAQNDFQTLSHTAANANWSSDFGHPAQMLKFIGEQFAIAGPILLVLIVLAALFGRRGKNETVIDAMRVLLAFSIPAMAIITVQSFISRAHGNWAAVAYPSAVAMAALYASANSRALLALKASLALHLVIGAGFLAAFVNAAFADAVGAAAAFKRLRGWEEQGAAVAEASKGYDAIMTDDREITGELVYYARSGKRIVAWNGNARIDNHFEAFNAYEPRRDQRVLYVTSQQDALYLKNHFSAITPISAVTARIGPRKTRTLYMFDVSQPTTR